jgi:hypothetical protein
MAGRFARGVTASGSSWNCSDIEERYENNMILDRVLRCQWTVRPYACPVEIRCTNCGREGTLVWEQTDRGRSLVRLSLGFYSLLPQPPEVESVIVCERCRQIYSKPTV